MIPSPEFLLNADRVRDRIRAAKEPLVTAVAALQDSGSPALADGYEPCAPRGKEDR